MAFDQITNAQLVKLRNDTKGHAYTLPEQEFERLFQENHSSIATVLGALQNIITKQLVSVDQIQFQRASRQYRVKARVLMGSNPVFEIADFISVSPLERDEVVLIRGERSCSVVSLAPFVIWDECPECHHERVLVTDDEGKYLDPQVGHRVDITTT